MTRAERVAAQLLAGGDRSDLRRVLAESDLTPAEGALVARILLARAGQLAAAIDRAVTRRPRS